MSRQRKCCFADGLANFLVLSAGLGHNGYSSIFYSRFRHHQSPNSKVWSLTPSQLRAFLIFTFLAAVRMEPLIQIESTFRFVLLKVQWLLGQCCGAAKGSQSLLRLRRRYCFHMSRCEERYGRQHSCESPRPSSSLQQSMQQQAHRPSRILSSAFRLSWLNAYSSLAQVLLPTNLFSSELLWWSKALKAPVHQNWQTDRINVYTAQYSLSSLLGR